MDGTPKREYHAPTVGVDRVVITEGIEVRPGVPLTIVTERDPVDPISRDLASGVYSPQYDRLLGLLQTVVPVGGRVLDLGAHIGTFSLAAAALGYEVLAVEASPQNAALLQASIEANGFRQMRVIHAAVSDRSGVLEFCAIGPWGHVSTPLLTTPTVCVPAVTVEQILDDHGWDRVDFVKIDIEGGEWPILDDPRFQGVESSIIVMEWHEAGCPYEDAFSAATAALNGAGYRTWGGFAGDSHGVT